MKNLKMTGVAGVIGNRGILSAVMMMSGILACKSVPAVDTNAAGSPGPDGTGVSASMPAQAGDYLVIDLSAGPLAAAYPVSYMQGLPGNVWPDEYKTSRLVLRRIPAGSFDPSSGRRGGSETPHQINLSRDFYIGVFEVTQKQWERVMGNWPSYFDTSVYRDTRPVERVSYDDIRGSALGNGWPEDSSVDADSFMGRLRERTGLAAFDLPTEAQWEYACRAGTTTDLNSGKNVTDGNCPHMADVGRYLHNGGAEYSINDGPSVGTAAVGSYLPNNRGLYDMHGNLFELCLDWFGRKRSFDMTVDPKGPATGTLRVRRGGSWLRGAMECGSHSRDRTAPDGRFIFVGFRVAMTPL